MDTHRPRKRFGQNFLHDPFVIERIVRAIAPRPGERIVEIGPGLGALTAPLLERARELDVVEIDRDVIPPLEKRCAGLGTLRIHNADVLEFDFKSIHSFPPPPLPLGEGRGEGSANPPEEKLRVVGNLPYNISTPLLFHLLDCAPVIRDMHFMLQKEVAERLAAPPATEAYGRLSVMVQYRCEVELLFIVGPGAFHPAPRVDSAVVRLIPRARPPVAVRDETRFAGLVKRAFMQRRKTLRNALKEMLDDGAFAAAGIDPARRAETLSLEEFAALANASDK